MRKLLVRGQILGTYLKFLWEGPQALALAVPWVVEAINRAESMKRIILRSKMKPTGPTK